MLRQQAALVHLLEDLPVVHVPDASVHLPGRVGLSRGRRQQPLNGVLQPIRQLAPIPVEELNPVLVGRVVRGGDDYPGVGVELAHQPGYARRGYHAQVDHVHPARHQTGVQCFLQHGAGLARVAPDHYRGFALLAADHTPGGLAEVQGKIGHQRPLADCTPDTICTKELAHKISLVMSC